MTNSRVIAALKPTTWFTNPRPNPKARLRLFCFPYAGGGSPIYRMWPDAIPATVDLWTAQLPGRGSRIQERPFTNLSPLVRALAEAIPPFLDRPFAFFGHSMGAMISFELARILQRRPGLKPSHLFVSGRVAPHITDMNRHTYDLPEAEFMEELRRLNGTPTEALEHPELMQLMTPLLRADFTVVGTYTYLPDLALNCPITAFGGLEDPEVSREHLEAWREHTTASFSSHMFPGDHFYLNTERTLLLRALSRELEQIQFRV
jgi:medium-chain acyl-[acyl-carrier-protein] hydrolase